MDFNIRRTFAYILSIIISGGFFMPKNKFQEVIFTIMMVLVMVYAMICYNIALATGGADKRDFCRRIPRTALYGAARISARFFSCFKNCI